MMAYYRKMGKRYFFIDKSTPFGSTISCCHFQRVSDGIKFIFKHRTGKRATNYLDDFFFVALMQLWCNNLVEAFLQICKEISFPVSLEKTVWGCQVIVFLGILLDTVNKRVRIPLEKRRKALAMITDVTEGSNIAMHM